MEKTLTSPESIAKKLKIGYHSSIISKADDKYIVIEDEGPGRVKGHPYLYRVIAYIPRLINGNKVNHELVGEMHYYFEPVSKKQYSITATISKENQEKAITAQMLKLIEGVAAINNAKQLTILAYGQEEINTLQELGYDSGFDMYNDQDIQVFPVSKDNFDLDIQEYEYYAELLEQATLAADERL